MNNINNYANIQTINSYNSVTFCQKYTYNWIKTFIFFIYFIFLMINEALTGQIVNFNIHFCIFTVQYQMILTNTFLLVFTSYILNYSNYSHQNQHFANSSSLLLLPLSSGFAPHIEHKKFLLNFNIIIHKKVALDSIQFLDILKYVRNQKIWIFYSFLKWR